MRCRPCGPRHVFDHAPAQRAYGHVGHRVLLSDLRSLAPSSSDRTPLPENPQRTQPLNRSRVQPTGRATPRSVLPRERFSSLARLSPKRTGRVSPLRLRTRIDQTSLVLRGDFEPISFPLYHGVRRASSGFTNSPLGMLVSSVCSGRQHMSPSAGGHLQPGFGAFRALPSALSAPGSRNLDPNRTYAPPHRPLQYFDEKRQPPPQRTSSR